MGTQGTGCKRPSGVGGGVCPEPWQGCSEPPQAHAALTSE